MVSSHAHTHTIAEHESMAKLHDAYDTRTCPEHDLCIIADPSLTIACAAHFARALQPLERECKGDTLEPAELVELSCAAAKLVSLPRGE